jgi:hypothetical protein
MTEDPIAPELVERLAMTHRTGRRALALGVASALMMALQSDLKGKITRRRVDGWLDAIDERWLAARQRERRLLRADVIRGELTPAASDFDRSLRRLQRAPLEREIELAARYGEQAGEAA